MIRISLPGYDQVEQALMMLRADCSVYGFKRPSLEPVIAFLADLATVTMSGGRIEVVAPVGVEGWEKIRETLNAANDRSE